MSQPKFSEHVFFKEGAQEKILPATPLLKGVKSLRTKDLKIWALISLKAAKGFCDLNIHILEGVVSLMYGIREGL